MRDLARFAALALAVALLAAGCSSVLAPQKDESQFFLLTASTDSGASAVPSSGRALTIGLGPVAFPDYLKRPEVVTRISADQLKLSENRRWAEPLDANFKAVLAQDLSRMLAPQQIVMFPWYPKTQLDYRVEVQVSRMDVSSDAQSVLIATWSIKDGANGNLLYSGATTATSPVAGDDAVGSAALSRDVGELGRQIADRIRSLSAGAAVTSKD